jgi:hypothetical protein
MIGAVPFRSFFYLLATGAATLALGGLSSCTEEENRPDDVVSVAAEPLTLGAVNVLTRNYGNLRTGANLSETVLKPSNVNTSSFGKVFQVSVDDQVYAGLLYASAVPIAGRNHNVFYVATVNNTVYAFDADVGGAPLWSKNFNGTGRASRNSETPCGPTGNFNFLSNIGIVGTPVIDGPSGTMYFVTRTVEGTSTIQRVRAIDITTGLDRSNSPKVISMTAPGTGLGSVGGNIAFDPFAQNQRPALALSRGVVYVAWAAYCDKGNYHGWTAGFDATTLNLTGASNDTPNGAMAGIWMGGAGPVADANGFVYVTSGNGDWNGTSNFGETLLKLSPSTLARSSFFTPGNVAALNAADDDLSSSGPMMLPIAGNLMVTGSKEGKIYMLSSAASNIGGMASGDTQIPQVFQAVVPSVRPSNTHHIHSAPLAWQSPQGLNLYVWGENDFLRMYRFNAATQKFNTTPAASGSILPPIGMPGGMLAVSANGSAAGTGVVWATVPKSGDASGSTVPGTLRAFDAETLALLWSSTTNTSGADDTFNLAKFNVPTVANGRVYVASFSNSVSVYGLRGSGSAPPAPTGLVATAGSGRAMLSWNASTGATGYDVKRATVSGGPFTLIGSSTSTRFTDTAATNGTTFFYVVAATNASGASANSAQVSATPNAATCRTAVGSGAFVNTAITSQGGSFTAEYDATPSVTNIDASIALSKGAQTAYAGYATITRFNPTGTIDARNAAAYAANSSIPYTAGSTYHFRLAVDVSARTYSIFVTPPGGSEIVLGTNFAFRSEQAGVTSLDNWGMKVSTTATSNTETACNFWIHP